MSIIVAFTFNSLQNAALAQSLPQGGVVRAGSASIATSGTQTNITTGTARTAIDWQSFSIGQGYSVDITQPNSTSITINEVVTASPSQIFGRLVSNGQVVIANPGGVWFGPTAHVDVGGLLATTATMSTTSLSNFANGGNLNFDQSGTANASIVNDGMISVAQGGLAGFVAPGVRNSGTITARAGVVTLASATLATVDLFGDGLINLAVAGAPTATPVGPDGNNLAARVQNSGTIIADAGTVQLTAKAASGVVDQLIDMSGVIEAHGVSTAGGTVELTGDNGLVQTTGKIDVASDTASAQAVLPGAVSPGRVPGQQPLPLPESHGEAPITLPPPTGAPLAPAVAATPVTLNAIIVEGSTVYPQATWAAMTAPLIGKPITVGRLFELAAAITARYRADGYIISRAVVPAQRIDRGMARIEIVEGYISKVTIEGGGDGALRGYADRITASRPLKASDLERYLLLANDLPGVHVRGVVEPATGQPGAAILHLVSEEQLVEGSLQLDNQGSLFAGPLEGSAGVTLNDVLGLSERTSLRYGEAFPYRELRYFQGQEDIPLGDDGLTLSISGGLNSGRPGFTLISTKAVSNGDNFGVRLPIRCSAAAPPPGASMALSARSMQQPCCSALPIARHRPSTISA